MFIQIDICSFLRPCGYINYPQYTEIIEMNYSIISICLSGQSTAQLDAYLGIGVLELETPYYNGYKGFTGEFR